MKIKLITIIFSLLGIASPKCSDKQTEESPATILSYKEIPDSLICSMYEVEVGWKTEWNYMRLYDCSLMFQSMKNACGEEKLRLIEHKWYITYIVNENGEIKEDIVTYNSRKNKDASDCGIDTISRNQLLDYLKANQINFHSLIQRDYDVCNRFTGLYIRWAPPVRLFLGKRYQKFLDSMGYTTEQLPKYEYFDLITQAFLDYDRRHQPMKNFERTYYY